MWKLPFILCSHSPHPINGLPPLLMSDASFYSLPLNLEFHSYQYQSSPSGTLLHCSLHDSFCASDPENFNQVTLKAHSFFFSKKGIKKPCPKQGFQVSNNFMGGKSWIFIIFWLNNGNKFLEKLTMVDICKWHKFCNVSDKRLFFLISMHTK